MVEARKVADEAEAAEEAAEAAKEERDNIEMVLRFEKGEAGRKAEAMPERADAADRSAEPDARSSEVAIDAVEAGRLCKV